MDEFGFPIELPNQNKAFEDSKTNALNELNGICQEFGISVFKEDVFKDVKTIDQVNDMVTEMKKFIRKEVEKMLLALSKHRTIGTIELPIPKKLDVTSLRTALAGLKTEKEGFNLKAQYQRLQNEFEDFRVNERDKIKEKFKKANFKWDWIDEEFEKCATRESVPILVKDLEENLSHRLAQRHEEAQKKADEDARKQAAATAAKKQAENDADAQKQAQDAALPPNPPVEQEVQLQDSDPSFSDPAGGENPAPEPETVNGGSGSSGSSAAPADFLASPSQSFSFPEGAEGYSNPFGQPSLLGDGNTDGFPYTSSSQSLKWSPSIWKQNHGKQVRVLSFLPKDPDALLAYLSNYDPDVLKTLVGAMKN